MFASIAPSYDLNNRLHSFWQDQRWRRKAAKLAHPAAADVIVDVACGTGDLTLAMHRRKLHAAKRSEYAAIVAPTIGIDFTYEMLPRAVAKSAEKLGRALTFCNADAQALPLVGGCCDVVSIAFGIRNVQQPQLALSEFYRILRPGGRLIILEFSEPTNPLIRWCNNLYSAKIMPHTATWLSHDKSGAYKYLPSSIKTFASRQHMMEMIGEAGFGKVQQFPMTFGVCVCYRGYKQ